MAARAFPGGITERLTRGVQAMAKVVYIVGIGRSGSTLVSRLLGCVPCVFSAGELAQVWRRGFRKNQLCGCGKPFRDCDVWREVSARVLRELHPLEPTDLLRAQADLERPHALAGLLTKSGYRRLAGPTSLLRQAFSVLYQAVAEVTGCRIIVDSSKRPAYALLVSTMEDVELSVIHLVRDSRAVCHSWTRKKLRPEIVGVEGYMSRSHPSKKVWRWILSNTMVEASSRRFQRFRRLRYEDFVRDPRGELERIVRWVEPREEPHLPFLGAGAAELPADHSVSGNPMRFQSGAIRIEEDDEWRHAMDPAQRTLVGLLSAPLLARYGYALHAGSARPRRVLSEPRLPSVRR
jgi:hypothetical protein